jgi:hypothetical protein
MLSKRFLKYKIYNNITSDGINDHLSEIRIDP